MTNLIAVSCHTCMQIGIANACLRTSAFAQYNCACAWSSFGPIVGLSMTAIKQGLRALLAGMFTLTAVQRAFVGQWRSGLI